MCNANTNGLEIGSKEIEFHPNDLRGGDFVADAVTAGCVNHRYILDICMTDKRNFSNFSHCISEV